jgi:hypothetical protein
MRHLVSSYLKWSRLDLPFENQTPKSSVHIQMFIVLIQFSDLVDKKNLEGLRIAVAHSDIRTIQRLCSTIPWAALAASEEAIQQSNASVLSSILELW